MCLKTQCYHISTYNALTQRISRDKLIQRLNKTDPRYQILVIFRDPSQALP